MFAATAYSTRRVFPVDPIYVADYATLRGITTSSMLCYITGFYSGGISTVGAGWFIRDDNNTTAPDDGVNTIVASNGKRWRRINDDVGILQYTSYTTLRATSGVLATTVQIVGTSTNAADATAGIFQLDTDDVTTPDDGGVVIVNAGGQRFKRQYDGYVSADWWKTFGDGASHLLSASYASLPLAQVDYPAATALTNQADWAALQGCINYLESIGGGVGYLNKRHYMVNLALTFNNHGPMLKGNGCGIFFGTDENQLRASEATCIEYNGSGTPLIHFTSVINEGIKSGGGLEDIQLNCGAGAGLATHGIRLTSWRGATFRNLMIFNATLWATKFDCFAGSLVSPTSGYDNQHNHFENVYSSVDNTSNLTGGGLVLTGGQGNGGTVDANSAFNTFIHTRWASADATPAVFLQATDNNTFIGLRANGGVTNLDALKLGCAQDDESGRNKPARYNNFFGVEASAGVVARASTNGQASSHDNAIYGYNTSNGGAAPVIQNGSGGSENADLWLYGGYRMYAPTQIIMPADSLIDYDKRSVSAALAATRSGTVSYSKAYLEEQGTLDPATIKIVGSTTAGVGTYVLASGTYTRVNRVVTFSMVVGWTAHTGAGNILIEGLPYAAQNTSNRTGIFNVIASNLTFTGQLAVLAQPNSKQMQLVSSSSGAVFAGVGTPLDTLATLYISGTYQCEQL